VISGVRVLGMRISIPDRHAIGWKLESCRSLGFMEKSRSDLYFFGTFSSSDTS
jgi:hypothetical protein